MTTFIYKTLPLSFSLIVFTVIPFHFHSLLLDAEAVTFLLVDTQIFERSVCWSLYQSIVPSVGPFVGLSVGPSLVRWYVHDDCVKKRDVVMLQL